MRATVQKKETKKVALETDCYNVQTFKFLMVIYSGKFGALRLLLADSKWFDSRLKEAVALLRCYCRKQWATCESGSFSGWWVQTLVV